MAIKHPNLKLACCGLLAAALLPACGGGSSSSSPATRNNVVEGTYQQGVAAGTAATLARVKTQLDELHASLTGPSGSAQGSGGFSSFARALEPRNRAALAEELQLLINRIETARSAAATADADSAEAAAAEAQRLADQALAALRLVVAADTAARAGGGEAVQTAAANALRRIATVDPMADDAQQTINAALTAALKAAEDQVEALERALAAAGGSDSDATLLEQLRTARDSLAAARTNLAAANAEVDRLAAAQGANSADAAWMARGVKPGFGFAAGTGPLPTSPESSTGKKPMVKFYRRTLKELNPDTHLTFKPANDLTFGGDADPRVQKDVFNPHGPELVPWNRPQGQYSFTGGAHGAGGADTGEWGGYDSSRYYTDNDPTMARLAGINGIDLNPDAVLYAPGQKRVIAVDPNTGRFRARGTVYRSGLPARPESEVDTSNSDSPEEIAAKKKSATNAITYVSGGAVKPDRNASIHHQRLNIQGRNSVMDNTWANDKQTARTTFRYDADEGDLIMGFGGDGVIFSDLEHYDAKGCNPGPLNCNNATTADIEIPFGAPDFDPAHQGMYYWSADVVSPRWGRAERNIGTAEIPVMTWDAADPAGRDHGQYRLLLSNGAGASRMLSYAAYGLFSFYDNLYNPGVPFYGRIQTFHYGVEAFADAADRRVTDMSSRIINGTFRGETHGWVVRGQYAGFREGGQGEAPGKSAYTATAAGRAGIDTLTRMRGDVTLTANIGGSADDNTISGRITNLMQSPVHDREAPVASAVPWSAEGLPETVELKGAYDNDVIGVAPVITATLRTARATYPSGATYPGDDQAARDKYLADRGIATGSLSDTAAVGADGAFKGTVTASGENAGSWEKGEYEGALYGPTEALEAAGTWWLQSDRLYNLESDAIIGSFGAVCTANCTPSP